MKLIKTLTSVKDSNKSPILISAVFFCIIFYISFFHNLNFTQPDGIFYYNAGKEILKGNTENILAGSSIAGPVIHAVLGDILGDGFTAGKIISLLGGTGIVFLSYYITKNLFDKKVALLTQLLFAVNAKIIFLSVMVLNETSPLFFIIISLYFATKKQKRIYDFLLIGLFLGISFSFRYQSIIVLLSFLIFLVIFERKKILKIKLPFLTFFSFLLTIIPVLTYNFIVQGKLFTGKSNMYILITHKFQTTEWHSKVEKIADEGLIAAFLIDPNLFLKNYFYNLLYHNPDHLFKFSVDSFDSLSIIPIIPIVGMIPVFGGFLYITKIKLTKFQCSIMILSMFILFLIILFFGKIEYHFMLLVIVPFAVLGISNIKKIPDNIKFLLILTIIFMIGISIIPVYRAYQLLPIWLIFPALSSLFLIYGIPDLHTKIKQLIHYEDKNEI